jgi:hypothetical protein
LTDCFVDLLLNLHSVEVPDRVLPKKIKLKGTRSNKSDMLHFKRATTNCISFVIILFIPSTKSQAINEISGNSNLFSGGI